MARGSTSVVLDHGRTMSGYAPDTDYSGQAARAFGVALRVQITDSDARAL